MLCCRCAIDIHGHTSNKGRVQLICHIIRLRQGSLTTLTILITLITKGSQK